MQADQVRADHQFMRMMLKETCLNRAVVCVCREHETCRNTIKVAKALGVEGKQRLRHDFMPRHARHRALSSAQILKEVGYFPFLQLGGQVDMRESDLLVPHARHAAAGCCPHALPPSAASPVAAAYCWPPPPAEGAGCCCCCFLASAACVEARTLRRWGSSDGLSRPFSASATKQASENCLCSSEHTFWRS